MRTMFDRLFAGRNGIDQLNIALFVLAILCWIGSLFAPTRGLANLLHWACLLAAAFCCVRAFSQNLGRRQQENQKFLAMTRGFRIGRNWRAKMEQKRQYKVFKCPSCGVKLRVPRGKGKIKVTCRQCGASFEERSWESLLRAVGRDGVPDCLKKKKKKKVWEKPLTMEERNAIISKLSQDTGWKVGEKEEKSSWQQLGFVLKYKLPCKSGVHLVN